MSGTGPGGAGHTPGGPPGHARRRRWSTALAGAVAFGLASGAWTVLPADAQAEPDPEPVYVVGERDADELPGGAQPTGDVATDPATGETYVLDEESGTVEARDRDGDTTAVYDLGAAGITDPAALAVARSADTTDDPGETSLFVADSEGGITELALAPLVAAAVTPQPSVLVQTIDTSLFVPPMPDASGITWLPAAGAFIVSDSEVEEVTGAGYQGVNLWRVRPDGTATPDGTTYPAFSAEPTGVGHDPATGSLLVSDDNADRVTFVRPGADGLYGTADDTRSFFSTMFNSDPDPEDVAYDPVSGDVFVVDGVSMEVYRVNRGGDGLFGTADDTVSSFDVEVHGARDPEGIAYDPDRDTLWIVDQRSKSAYELAKTGELVRIVDIRPTNSVAISGIEIAPGSVRPDRRTMWLTDRGLDNNPFPDENDGKIYELSFDTGSNTPPVVNTVSITPTAPGTNTVLTATATGSDPDGDPFVFRYQWRRNGVAIPGQTAQTLDLALAGNGDKGDNISVRVVGFDGIAEGAAKTSGQVTVVDSPPVFAQDLPDRTDAEYTAVSFPATAIDPDGDPITYGATGLPAGVTINTSTGVVGGTIGAGASAGSPYDVTVTAVAASAAAAPDTFRWTVTPGTPPTSSTTTSSTTTPPSSTTTTTAPPPPPARSGYWMVDGAGKVYRFGNVPFLGNAPSTGVTDIEPTADGNGYWIVTSRGQVYAFGTARPFGNADPSRLAPGEIVVSMTATRDGKGYWLFTNRGRALTFGNARWYGDLSRLTLVGPVVASIATATGNGYYMVGSDGGVFAFGDARFYGSMGGKPLVGPIVGLVPDGDGVGYWLVASDGGVFAFQAPFRGSMGGIPLNRPVIGLLRYGNGYLMVASDGGIFVFSDKPFAGSLGSNPPSRPIVNAAAV